MLPNVNPSYYLRMARMWAPTVAGFSAAGAMAGLYFTDIWIGKEVLQYVPWIGDRYQPEKPHESSE